MSVLSDAVKKIDTSGDQKKEIAETLNLLVELTSAKADSYKQVIEDSLRSSKLLGNDKEISSLYFPISAVKDSRIEYRCIAQNQPTDLVDKIAESISQMIDDHSAAGIVKGISSIINSALQPLLGLASGMEQYCASTTTFIEGTGIAVNIMRMDCIIWGRAISAESIKQQINKTFACVAYKSVVNIKKLSFGDFRAVYAPVIEATGETDPIAALKNAKEIYDLLEGGSELKNQAKQAVDDKALTVSDLIYLSKPTAATDGKF